MDTNENEEQPTPEPIPTPEPALTPESIPAPVYDPGLILTQEAQSYLKETGKWASFLSIMGFIFCGLFLIIALFVGTVFSYFSKLSPTYSSMPQTGLGFVSVIYILMDVLYFFFPFYLYRFADRIKKGLTFSDSANVTEALSNLKSFFKLWGIVTIIFVGFYAIMLIFVVLVGVGSGAFHS